MAPAMTETNPSLEAIATILDAAAEREPYKHTALNEIFNAAFWDVKAGVYAAPLTMQEIELRFNRVVLGLSALYEVPTRGSDGLPCLRTTDSPKSVVQEQLDAFYTSEATPEEVEALWDPATTKPNFEDEPEWWPSLQEIREGILRQCAVKVGALPAGQPGSLKFSLNVPALERLIGGDSAIEVELRKSIVQEFAKRHLTAVAKEMTETLKGDLKKAVETQMEEAGLCEKKTGWMTYKVLTPEIQQQISAFTKEAVGTQAASMVRNYIDARMTLLAQDMDARIEAAINSEIENRVRLKLADILNRAMRGG
jgi:hypothetical protein